MDHVRHARVVISCMRGAVWTSVLPVCQEMIVPESVQLIQYSAMQAVGTVITVVPVEAVKQGVRNELGHNRAKAEPVDTP
jgi:hypothetical protein